MRDKIKNRISKLLMPVILIVMLIMNISPALFVSATTYYDLEVIAQHGVISWIGGSPYLSYGDNVDGYYEAESYRYYHPQVTPDSGYQFDHWAYSYSNQIYIEDIYDNPGLIYVTGNVVLTAVCVETGQTTTTSTTTTTETETTTTSISVIEAWIQYDPGCSIEIKNLVTSNVTELENTGTTIKSTKVPFRVGDNYSIKTIASTGYVFESYEIKRSISGEILTISTINDYQFQITGGNEIQEGDYLKVNVIEGTSGETVNVNIGLIGVGTIQVYSEYGTKILEWTNNQFLSSDNEYELSSDIQYRFVVIPGDGYQLDKWIYEDNSYAEIDRYYTETIYIDNLQDDSSIHAWIIEENITTTTTTQTTQTTQTTSTYNADEGYVYLKVYIPEYQGKRLDTELHVGVNTSNTSYQQWSCPPDPNFGYYYGGVIIPNLENCYVLRVPVGTQVYLTYYMTVNWDIGVIGDSSDDIIWDFISWKGEVDDFYTTKNKTIVLFMDENKKIYCNIENINKSDNIGDLIQESVTDAGMDNSTGYWILTIIGMVIAYLIFKNDNKLKFVMPMIVLGLGVVIGWLSGPLVILLIVFAAAIGGMAVRKAIKG